MTLSCCTKSAAQYKASYQKLIRKSDNKMKSFCNLVLQGRLSAAVKVLTQTDATGVLPPTEHVRAKMAFATRFSSRSPYRDF